MKKMIAAFQNKILKGTFNRASRNQSSTKVTSKRCAFAKEYGSGGPLIYAMCFVGLMTCVMIFLFIEYRSRIYMLKDDMETKLHIVENYCLTVNQRTDGNQDTFERERERAHIVTVGANNSSATIAKRIEQVNEIGNAFSRQFKESFDLDGIYPQSGFLLMMSKPSKDNKYRSTMTIKEVTIYEPTYSMGEVSPVYCNNNNPDHGHNADCKNKLKAVGMEGEIKDIGTDKVLGTATVYCNNKKHTHTVECQDKAKAVPTGFDTKPTATEWYTYKLSFNGNNYASCGEPEKSETAPMLSTGVPAEGATIEATIVATFYQPDNFVIIEPPVMHTVEVHEAIDIVYASEDSRKK